MILSDNLIKEYGANLITPFNSDKLGSMSYDLDADLYCTKVGDNRDEIDLMPGESTFVQAVEAIQLPPNIIARVILRNSRIRQGLTLDAPIYQPGHHTKVYFRITNISKETISLKKSDGIAAIMFEQLDQNADRPYSGTYQDEIDFRGMGKYTNEYGKRMTDLDNKVEEINGIARSIYGNVLAIMAIFVAVFSLINVNVSILDEFSDTKQILTINFTMIGAIAFLIAMINSVLPGKHSIKVWAPCIIVFIIAFILLFI